MEHRPVRLDLRWQGGMRFAVRAGTADVILDGDGAEGPSPVQALAAALAGCMATDLVLILKKGRQALQSLEARLEGTRAEEDPRRFVAIDIGFTVRGDVPRDRVAHALELSKEKYCSVWHSMRRDIQLSVSFEVHSFEVHPAGGETGRGGR